MRRQVHVNCKCELNSSANEQKQLHSASRNGFNETTCDTVRWLISAPYNVKDDFAFLFGDMRLSAGTRYAETFCPNKTKLAE